MHRSSDAMFNKFPFLYMIEMCANVLNGRSKSFIKKKNKLCSLMEAVYV